MNPFSSTSSMEFLGNHWSKSDDEEEVSMIWELAPGLRDKGEGGVGDQALTLSQIILSLSIIV